MKRSVRPTAGPPHPDRRRLLKAAMVAAPLMALPLALPGCARASESREVIDLRVRHALDRLYASVPGARELMGQAKGVLVIPGITKAGLLVGGMYGEGSLSVNGSVVGYYSVGAASFGIQAGVQKFDQALFFMTTAALEKFRRSQGWEMGAEAEITTPEDALATSVTTTTAQSPVISVTFGQEGLMAGISLEGAKYTRIGGPGS